MHTDKETKRQSYTQTHSQRDKHTHRYTVKETQIQIDKQKRGGKEEEKSLDDTFPM